MNNDIKSLQKQVAILKQFVEWNLSADYDSRERGTRAREVLGAVAILEPQQSAPVAAQPQQAKSKFLNDNQIDRVVEEWFCSHLERVRGEPGEDNFYRQRMRSALALADSFKEQG